MIQVLDHGVTVWIANDDRTPDHPGGYKRGSELPEILAGMRRAGPQELGLPVDEIVRSLLRRIRTPVERGQVFQEFDSRT